jgi:hypothetical protein
MVVRHQDGCGSLQYCLSEDLNDNQPLIQEYPLQLFVVQTLNILIFCQILSIFDNLDYSISSFFIPRTHTRILNDTVDSYTN